MPGRSDRARTRHRLRHGRRSHCTCRLGNPCKVLWDRSRRPCTPLCSSCRYSGLPLSGHHRERTSLPRRRCTEWPGLNRGRPSRHCTLASSAQVRRVVSTGRCRRRRSQQHTGHTQLLELLHTSHLSTPRTSAVVPIASRSAHPATHAEHVAASARLTESVHTVLGWHSVHGVGCCRRHAKPDSHLVHTICIRHRAPPSSRRRFRSTAS